MCRAFVHFTFFLENLHVAEIAESRFQHRPGVEVLHLFRSAGSVFKLLGGIALEDQEAAGFQRLTHPCPFPGTAVRRTELGEYFDDDIELAWRIGPRVNVDVHQCDFYAALPGECCGFLLPGLGKIERSDIQSLFGKPDAVASFAVRDGKIISVREYTDTLHVAQTLFTA